jgi:hypothetical protein
MAKNYADRKARHIAALRAACAKAIVTDYVSGTLGAAHTYPSSPTDQTNRQAAWAASLMPGQPDGWTAALWCADGSEAWLMRPHTAAQVQKAASDGFLWVQMAQSRLVDLIVRVNLAATADTIQAVVW